MTTENDQETDPLLEQPFVSHLVELRDRLLRAVVGVLAIFFVLFPFNNDIYVMVATPLMAQLPEGSSMIATEVASPFLTPFKLTLMAAVFLAMPFILYQLWSFIAPGLYKHEKRLMMPLVASSALLFYLGMVFAYYVVFPLVFAFMANTTPDGVQMATDIARYLDFVMTLFFAFGIAFEVPIATIILVSMGMTTPDKLVEKRPYIIVGAFCIGMFLTPPDVISQTLLALPMWVLFELGVFFSRIVKRRKDERERQQEETPDQPLDGGGASNPAPAPAKPAAPAAAAVADDMIAPFESDPVSAGGGDQIDPERFVPLTPEELDAELDAIEAEEEEEDEGDLGESDDEGLYEDVIDEKLRQIQTYREQEEYAEARILLYEVLSHGNEEQCKVARNILEQLDQI